MNYPLPIDYRTQEERDIDEHWEQFLAGDIPDCPCDHCDQWKANRYDHKRT